MISNEKIRWMTRAALYEKKERKQSLRVNRFNQSDYVSWNVIKSLIGATVGYLLIIVLYILYGSESMLDEITLPFLLKLARQFLFGYILLAAAAGCLSFIVYTRRYQQARKKKRAYAQYLKKINRIYQKESGAGENL